ncbi:hypothetical protein MMC22_007549 [Lobaria immixta]|nr:hypothetical protein [Lobaria immixta]
MIILLAIGLASRVAAHGFMRTASAGGETCACYHPNYQPDPACTASIPADTDNGYIDHNGYRSRDIICHKGATVGNLTLKVEAGHDIEIQWTSWPESHHGYMMNALSNCNGPCQDANLEKLKFNMITHEGFISPNPGVVPGKNVDGKTCGKWALDIFRQQGSKSKFTVPSCLAPGYYLLRQEVIALHSAMPAGSGAQNIPQCLNIEVTGSGTDKLTGGTSPMTWYDKKSTTMDIFNNLRDYPMVGPDLYPICRNAPSNGDSPVATDTTEAQSSETQAVYNVTKVPSTGSNPKTNDGKDGATQSNGDDYSKSPTPRPSSSSLPKKSEHHTSDAKISSYSSYSPTMSETHSPDAKVPSGSSSKKNEADTSDAEVVDLKESGTINGCLTTLEKTVEKLRYTLSMRHPYRRRHARGVAVI